MYECDVSAVAPLYAQAGSTALIWSATYGHAECARLLMDAGANKEAKDNVRLRSCMCVSVYFSGLMLNPISHISLIFASFPSVIVGRGISHTIYCF
jgi:hypothetical protein